jgi:hypothetical protein
MSSRDTIRLELVQRTMHIIETDSLSPPNTKHILCPSADYSQPNSDNFSNFMRRLPFALASMPSSTLIKKKMKFSLYIKGIQMGAVAKSYMRKGFLIYEEIRKYLTIHSMRRPLVISDFGTAPF